ncbi:hypothetical protein PQ478_08435 [Alkalihalophilus pseudofirmus]|nr:hypothetical protein [Alkalihalophilus pseudofirmus]WEG18495.1 hypothetical protein PQ478_08435 [Alkalihalophilus pseudofirmus]
MSPQTLEATPKKSHRKTQKALREVEMIQNGQLRKKSGREFLKELRRK